MQATWIWYPGDFEVWLGNNFNNRRTERGAMFPPFWKQDSHWPTVVFIRDVDLSQDEVITAWSEGEFNFMLDGKLCSAASRPDVVWHDEDDTYDDFRIRLPEGKHTLTFKVWNQLTPPALFVKGETFHSDNSWLTTYEDKIWIDENGVAHGSGIYVPAASWNFDEPGTPPSQYALKWEEKYPLISEDVGDGTLYDFGRETFGILDFRLAKGDGVLHIYYGESREEALDKQHCETLDYTRIVDGHPLWKPQTNKSKAFRYVYIETTGTADFQLAMFYEHNEYDELRSGAFRCSDEELNNIWKVAAYTLDLTTREFFVDGIKRDRWVWSGDAIQSYLMNYYLRFDSECVKRTIRQLRGKDPVTAHVNTIMDYTFYWFVSISDYYQYTGDNDFLREIYPSMQTLMDYVENRLDSNGMAVGKDDDWIFVDWTDFPMHKRGVLCFEQILLCMAYFSHARVLHYLGDMKKRSVYLKKMITLLKKIKETFWSEEKGAFLHALEEGKLDEQVTRFPSIMTIYYRLPEEEKHLKMLEHVLLNPDVPPITTPYMRFYELSALCLLHRHEQVLQDIKEYWGGMLREGATTFWEKYNPEEHGTEHLAMYGRPYGKSLCHAWGASPLYIIGRYFLGVTPTKPGYEEYEVCPVLGGLEWMGGAVPTPRGVIRVSRTQEKVWVFSELSGGTLIVADKKYPIVANRELTVKL